MATFGDRLRELREEQGLSQVDLGKILTLSQSTVALYENNKREPNQGTLQHLSKVFAVSIDYLVGCTSIRQVATLQQASTSRTATIPILGRIKAGIPFLAEENWEGEVEIPSDIKADFALRISGDSMSWAGIADGDTAVLRKTDSPPNGAVVAAVIENDTWEATLKFFVRENGGAVLRAGNPAYKDIHVSAKLRVVGQLVALLKNPPTVSDYLAHLVHKDISDRKWQYAIELATQAGLDGESVANIISAVMKTAKQLGK